MSKLSRMLWLSLLLVFGACNVAEMVLMALSFDPLGERDNPDPSPGDRPVEAGDRERAEAATRRCENLERILKERLSALEAEGRPAAISEQAIEAAARERLDEKLDQERKQFTDALIRTLGEHVGRELDAGEREAVDRANRSYFDALDEVGDVETINEKNHRLDAAARERVETLTGIAGSSGEASRLVAAAMYALE